MVGEIEHSNKYVSTIAVVLKIWGFEILMKNEITSKTMVLGKPFDLPKSTEAPINGTNPDLCPQVDIYHIMLK